MNNGFIKLHRKILDWEWYDDPNCMRLFLHCLLRANFKDNNWRGIIIKRGSFLTSIDTLSKETNLSISQIRTSIKKLKSTREIASLSHARHSVITIVEYDSYQSIDKLDDIDVTLESQTSDIEIATNKNVKKEKKVKNKPIVATAPDFIDAELWNAWVKFRSEIKKKLTPSQITQQTKFLKEQPDPNEIIRRSIKNGWQGLFEIKGQRQSPHDLSNQNYQSGKF